MSECDRTAETQSPPGRREQGGDLFPGSPSRGLAEEGAEGCWDTEAWCCVIPILPARRPWLPPSRLWTPVRRLSSDKGLALSSAICGSAAHVGLLLGWEEGFVCWEGQRGGQPLLPFNLSPRMSAAFAGTVFFLFQIGHGRHLCRDTPLLSGWLCSLLLGK